MATSAEAVRVQLAVVSAAAAQDVASAAAQATLERQADAALAALGLVIPAYYDAAGILATSWYDELRDEAQPAATYVPSIIGDPTTDWIEREAAKYLQTIEADLEQQMEQMLAEVTRLTEKEVARGFRDTILGNSRIDDEAIGWSRVTRPGACKLCVMLADKGAVYSKATANFSAHTDCHCASRPEFRGGVHGPEATVEQYLASRKRRTPRERAVLREYLNTNYPDSPG